jgi:hypothetical protein
MVIQREQIILGSTKGTKDTKSTKILVSFVDQRTYRFHSSLPLLPKLMSTPTRKPVALR